MLSLEVITGKTRASTATIVGAGPNGLAAAIVLGRAGFAVDVREASSVAGGATRSAALTLPGFVHDLGSAVHPLAVASPFFSTLPLAEAGLHWIWPSAALAHPLDDGTAVMVEREVSDTASQLGDDAAAYRRLYNPLVAGWDGLRHDLLKAIGWPGHPLAMARFGLLGLRSARSLVDSHFKGTRARALFAGLAAHSFLPLESPVSAAFGLVLGITAHAAGWPIPQGGAQSIAGALVSCLQQAGGSITTNARVLSLRALGNPDLILLDVTPRQLLRLGGEEVRRRSAVNWNAIAMGPEFSKWIGHSASRFRGERANACAPARSIWAAASMRLRPRNGSRSEGV